MTQKIPKGRLLIIGGAENKAGHQDSEISDRNRNFQPLEILSELVPKGGAKKITEIITTASSVPDEVEKTYREAFANMDFHNVQFLHIGNNEQANNPEYVKRIEEAYAVFFSGGDQFRLGTILGASDVVEAIQKRYEDDPDFILAGTSAGAMAASELMIYEGAQHEAMLQGSVRMSSGLRFITGCIIDTHFIKRGRFERLAQSLVMNPTCIGIGLGEDTALLIKEGNKAECKGSGMVIIIDGKDIGHTNVSYAEEDIPLSIEGLKVHILSRGSKFLLQERKFIPSDEDMELEREAMTKNTDKAEQAEKAEKAEKAGKKKSS